MSNGYVLHAPESGGWGVIPTTGWRNLEIATDDHKSTGEPLQWSGLRAASGAPKAAGRRIVKRGSEFTAEVPAYSNGLGVFLRAAATTANSAVHAGGTLAYDQTYTFDGGPPLGRSICAEVYRDAYTDGLMDVTTYPGGKIKSTTITQSTDGHLMFKFDVNGKASVRQGAIPTRSETEVDPDFIYAWPDATITLTPVGGAGVAQIWESFDLTLPSDLDTEAWGLKAATAEYHTITKTGTWSAGTFTLTVLGVTTANIAYNATAATIQTALLTAGVPIGHVTVTGGPISTTAVVFTFNGDLGDVVATTINTASVTGSTPAAGVVVTAGTTGLRREPKSKGTPAPSGSLSWKYDGPTYQDAAWYGQQEFSLSAVWQGDTVIEGTTYPSLTITIPSLFFTGDDPVVSSENPTMQSLNFDITDNDTDPAVSLVLVTSDTDF